MAHLIQAPPANKLSNIGALNYPVDQLNKEARENISIGRKINAIKDNKEYKDLAITLVALGAIFFVGSIIAASFSLATLSSILAYSGLTGAMAGSGYFVVTHFLDPLKKIESQREKMRFLPIDKVLDRSLDDIEGYDLLKRAIEDKTLDSKEKVKTYICLRQLKRNLENLKLLKVGYDQKVEVLYLACALNLKSWEDREIRAILSQRPRLPQEVIKLDTQEVGRLYDDALKNYKDWKNNSKNDVNEQFKAAVNQLDLQYQNLLNNLGSTPRRSSWVFWR